MLASQILHQLKTCATRRTPFPGKKLHAHLVKSGWNLCVPVANTIIDMYGKCGLVADAANMFDEMPQRNLIAWASVLSAYNQRDLPGESLCLFRKMYSADGLCPDHFVMACVVKACCGLGSVKQGKQVHGRFVVSEFCDDDVVKSSLVDMYAKCGRVDDARRVFDSIVSKNLMSLTAMVSGYARSGRRGDAAELFWRMPERNLYSWTALISGLVQSGNEADAIEFFKKMRVEGVDVIDPFVVSCIIGACANLAALELGKQIHGWVVSLGFDSCLFSSNSLVDMYAKCSDIVAAHCVFTRMVEKDVVSWTSIIVGEAQHGRAEEALRSYDEMILEGVRPNEVTFVGLMYACSHAGLVSKGRLIFDSMAKDYGIRPSLLHYTCLLDLLSRTGKLDEAEDVINTMKCEPDEATWAALLSACQRHKRIEMGLRIADHLFTLKPEDPSTYILLSNAYASSNAWEKASAVRKVMQGMDLQKQPGYSRIQSGKEMELFYAGETTHPMKDAISKLLRELNAEMDKRGYVPDTISVLHDLEQHEKEKQLFWHSERLAVAYGLLKSVPGTVIRIVKNLRVCPDCHTVLKHISSIMRREIIVRDATRYHHFKDGACTCRDFW
uniref:DYW domain-containing protein n=1 Tax=Kalanchoe fedtschenkoi TaxID=63787 RepID=A0A7N0TDS4_KALFE